MDGSLGKDVNKVNFKMLKKPVFMHKEYERQRFHSSLGNLGMAGLEGEM